MSSGSRSKPKVHHCGCNFFYPGFGKDAPASRSLTRANRYAVSGETARADLGVLGGGAGKSWCDVAIRGAFASACELLANARNDRAERGFDFSGRDAQHAVARRREAPATLRVCAAPCVPAAVYFHDELHLRCVEVRDVPFSDDSLQPAAARRGACAPSRTDSKLQRQPRRPGESGQDSLRGDAKINFPRRPQPAGRGRLLRRGPSAALPALRAGT